MARVDQEDEFFEKDPDEVIPAGFHIVDEDAKEEDDLIIPKEDEEDDALPLEDVEVEDEIVGGFGGKDFDFEHADEEES